MTKGLQVNPDVKEAQIAHLCAELEKGILSQNQILAAMDPPLSRWTLREWRKADLNVERRISEAFELGGDNMATRMQLTARGKREAAGGDSTGNIDRDKLVLWLDEKLIARRYQRYQQKTVLANDPVNPVTSAKPSALTEEQLLLIAAQGARGKPDGNG